MLLRKRIRLLCVLLAVLLFALAIVGIAIWEARHSDFSSSSDWEMAEYVEHNGEYYRLRTDVDTLLVMGVDKFSDAAVEGSYNNDQCADFLLLLAIDRKSERCSVIAINRDTVTDVPVLGIGGKRTGTVRQQITLAHTYGTGGEDSCRNTAHAVSELFGGLIVDGFVCLTMDAVGILNDAVGGVSVTIKGDLTAIDPAFCDGQTVCLTGEQALRFVRFRAGLADSTNASRMERQEQYLSAFYTALLGFAAEEETIPTDVAASLSPHMHSDLSASELERAYETLPAFGRGEFSTLAGDYTVGEFMEFHPDEEDLKEKILSLFYEKI